MARTRENIISEMQRNSNAWHGASEEERERLRKRNEELAGAMDALTGGRSVYDGASGTWRLSDGTRSVSIGGNVEYISPERYGDREGYTGEVRQALDRLGNYRQFSYSPETDPLYSAYRKQYVREGDRAARDTLGSAAALTGGMPSSWAASAAQQAQNYYNAQLTDKIPELASLAYEIYADEYAREYDRLTALMEADAAEYSRWESDRDYRYAASRDEIEDARYADELAYSRQQDREAAERYADELAYSRGRDEIEDARYADELAYSRQQDREAAERYAAEFAYEQQRDSVADARYADELVYERWRDSVADARYADELAYERAADEAERESGSGGSGSGGAGSGGGAADGGDSTDALYREMMDSDDPEGWLERNARYLSDEEFALLWDRLYR